MTTATLNYGHFENYDYFKSMKIAAEMNSIYGH